MTVLKIVINKDIDTVWDYIKEIDTHINWMIDAKSIELKSGTPNTIGAKYLCVTKVAFLKTNDNFEILKYSKPDLIEILHSGVVSGSGYFRLNRIDSGTTEFIWEEQLKFPWQMGSIVGKKIAMLLLHKIWKKNLLILKDQVEKA